jgi:hypothetical protein
MVLALFTLGQTDCLFDDFRGIVGGEPPSKYVVLAFANRALGVFLADPYV